MNTLSLAFAAAFTLAIGWFAVATALRVRVWLVTPSPLPIPLAPAPRTRAGVAARLAAEILLFRSLARASFVTWVPAILFHYGLLVVLIVHLRFLFPVLPSWLLPFLLVGGWATLALAAGLVALLARRVLVDRVRRVSAPSDYLHVALLLAIVASGAAVKRLWPADLYRVGEFVRGVATLDWQPLPAHAGLLGHLLGVLLLLIVFPISKLLHAPGIAFAPTFHQRDPGARAGHRSSRSSGRSGASRFTGGHDEGDPVAKGGEGPPPSHEGRTDAETEFNVNADPSSGFGSGSGFGDGGRSRDHAAPRDGGR